MQVKVMHNRKKGLGDVVESALSVFAIGKMMSKMIESATNKPCGCTERKNALNKIELNGTKQDFKVLR